MSRPPNTIRSFLALLLLVAPLAADAWCGPRGGGNGAGGARSGGIGSSPGLSRSTGERPGVQRSISSSHVVSRNAVNRERFQATRSTVHRATTGVTSPTKASVRSLHPIISANRLPTNLPHAAGPMRVPRTHVPQFTQHLQTALARHQVQQVIACAPHRIVSHRHCHWWFPYLCGVYHIHHRPWVCNDAYWFDWTPCSFRVVRCPKYVYYVGLECITIPDIGALGVQTVYPHSPADQAGLHEGDLLVSVNGRQPVSGQVLTEEVATGNLLLEVLRDGADVPTFVSVIPEMIERE